MRLANFHACSIANAVMRGCATQELVFVFRTARSQTRPAGSTQVVQVCEKTMLGSFADLFAIPFLDTKEAVYPILHCPLCVSLCCSGAPWRSSRRHARGAHWPRCVAMHFLPRAGCCSTPSHHQCFAAFLQTFVCTRAQVAPLSLGAGARRRSHNFL